MLSKTRIKFIRSLRLIKFRLKERLFVIEGDKLVKEALDEKSNQRFKIHSIYGLDTWIKNNERIVEPYEGITEIINNKELSQISQLTTPNQILALIHLNTPEQSEINIHDSLIIGLDNIQDPGNMGTIIRLADWFGVNDIILSRGCADPFSPKVVQATMGSIFRIRLHELDLQEWLAKLPEEYNVYGAILSSDNLYKKKLTKEGIILFGNESKGLSSEVESFVNSPLTIPRVPRPGNGPDSLNVSVAAGIILNEFSRQDS